MQLLEAEPAVAGRLHDVELSELKPGWSGATVVYGTWDGPVQPVYARLGTTTTTNADGSFPVIIKLGAGAREVNWATQLWRHAPDLVPGVYAAGYTLGGEPLPWMVMERCPYRLDYRWGHHLYTMLMDAGVRYHLAARYVAPPVGPADVWVDWFCSLVRRGLTSDLPAPGPAERVVARLADDWEWVLSLCRVEFAHGDLHLANAVWRTTPPDPAARALLVDYAPHPLPWAAEAAYCQVLYWPGGTGHPTHPTLVHEMAALRTAHRLEVPAPADVDRLAALIRAWYALRIWPNATHRHGIPEYVASVTRWIEHAAVL